MQFFTTTSPFFLLWLQSANSQDENYSDLRDVLHLGDVIIQMPVKFFRNLLICPTSCHVPCTQHRWRLWWAGWWVPDQRICCRFAGACLPPSLLWRALWASCNVSKIRLWSCRLYPHHSAQAWQGQKRGNSNLLDRGLNTPESVWFFWEEAWAESTDIEAHSRIRGFDVRLDQVCINRPIQLHNKNATHRMISRRKRNKRTWIRKLWTSARKYR